MTWRVLVLGTALAALTLTFGAAASAEDDDDDTGFNRLGGYVQLSGVVSPESFSGGLTGDTTGGFSLRTGNRFHRYFSIEFQYEFVGKREVERASLHVTDLYSHHITMNFRSYFLAGVSRGRVQPFLIGGFGVGIFDSPVGDDVGFVARGGGGLEVYVSHNVVISGEVVYALSAGGAGGGLEIAGGDVLSLKDLDHVSASLGVAYRF